MFTCSTNNYSSNSQTPYSAFRNIYSWIRRRSQGKRLPFQFNMRAILSVTWSAIALTAYARHNRTVYLAGDSTMAEGGSGPGTNTDGWGQYFGQYMAIPVVNMALGGTSARSFTVEGHFDTIINTVKKGDFVVIEFGHNDGSSGTVDNGNQDAPGSNVTTTETITAANGTSIVIHTFNFYIDNAVNALKVKGAIPIISSQTPDNIWNGSVIANPPEFVADAQIASVQTSVTYVDHYNYVATQYESIGEATVDTFYPNDHLHTSPTGANVVAQAFVRGLACGKSKLTKYINEAGRSVPLAGQCI